MTAEQAAREVLRECFDQIVVNCDVLAVSEDPEGPHQLRVGLRRLRSAFSVFGPAIDSPEAQRLRAEARWLGHEVGALRDLDVVRSDILAPEAAAYPAEVGFAILDRALAKAASRQRKEVQCTLAGPRAQAFLLDLARFIETRGWLMQDDMDQTRRLAMPVLELARQALDKRRKAAAGRARRIEALEIEARHELRKELKKMRYAVEFMAPLFPPRKVAAYVKRLKKLQTVFGDLNDASMAHELLSGEGAPGARDLAAQRARGWIIGARLERAERGWDRAKSLWGELKAQKPFWT